MRQTRSQAAVVSSRRTRSAKTAAAEVSGPPKAPERKRATRSTAQIGSVKKTVTKIDKAKSEKDEQAENEKATSTQPLATGKSSRKRKVVASRAEPSEAKSVSRVKQSSLVDPKTIPEMTVASLKVALRSLGLRVGGNKAELQDRLRDAFEINEKEVQPSPKKIKTKAVSFDQSSKVDRQKHLPSEALEWKGKDINSMTVVELKQALKSLQLSVTGKKSDLLKRLTSALSSDEIESGAETDSDSVEESTVADYGSTERSRKKDESLKVSISKVEPPKPVGKVLSLRRRPPAATRKAGTENSLENDSHRLFPKEVSPKKKTEIALKHTRTSRQGSAELSPEKGSSPGGKQALLEKPSQRASRMMKTRSGGDRDSEEEKLSAAKKSGYESPKKNSPTRVSPRRLSPTVDKSEGGALLKRKITKQESEDNELICEATQFLSADAKQGEKLSTAKRENNQLRSEVGFSYSREEHDRKRKISSPEKKHSEQKTPQPLVTRKSRIRRTGPRSNTKLKRSDDFYKLQDELSAAYNESSDTEKEEAAETSSDNEEDTEDETTKQVSHKAPFRKSEVQANSSATSLSTSAELPRQVKRLLPDSKMHDNDFADSAKMPLRTLDRMIQPGKSQNTEISSNAAQDFKTHPKNKDDISLFQLARRHGIKLSKNIASSDAIELRKLRNLLDRAAGLVSLTGNRSTREESQANDARDFLTKRREAATDAFENSGQTQMKKPRHTEGSLIGDWYSNAGTSATPSMSKRFSRSEAGPRDSLLSVESEIISRERRGPRSVYRDSFSTAKSPFSIRSPFFDSSRSVGSAAYIPSVSKLYGSRDSAPRAPIPYTRRALTPAKAGMPRFDGPAASPAFKFTGEARRSIHNQNATGTPFSSMRRTQHRDFDLRGDTSGKDFSKTSPSAAVEKLIAQSIDDARVLPSYGFSGTRDSNNHSAELNFRDGDEKPLRIPKRRDMGKRDLPSKLTFNDDLKMAPLPVRKAVQGSSRTGPEPKFSFSTTIERPLGFDRASLLRDAQLRKTQFQF